MKIIFAAILFIMSTLCYGQWGIVFEKQTTFREYSIWLPYPCTIKMKNGKKKTGVLYKQNDNEICFKTISEGHKFTNDTIISKKIISDTLLSRKEKKVRLLFISYPDTECISYDSIQNFHYDLYNKRENTFRVSDGLIILIVGIIMFYGLVNNGEPLDREVIFSVAPLTASYYLFRKFTFKWISTKKWNMKNSYAEYDITIFY